MQTEYAGRLHRLRSEPDSIESLWTELRRPFLRWLDYAPELKTTALSALYERDALSRTGVLLEHAWQEFGDNLEALEKNYLVYGENAAQHLNWLERAYTVLLAAQRSHELERGEGVGATERWLARRRMQALRGQALLPLQAEDPSGPAVSIRLAGVDALLGAADAENNFLGRRRKLLEGARELLLVAAEGIVDQAGVQARFAHVTNQLGEIARLQAGGVNLEVALPHQLVTAAQERSPTRLSTLLSAVEQTALTDPGPRAVRVGEVSGKALERLWGDHDRSSPAHRQRSVALSGTQTLQAEVTAAITRGYATAAESWERQTQAQGTAVKALQRHVERYLSESAETDLIHASLYVDSCVDVGGVLSPQRVFDVETRVREVPYPTQKLTLRTAESVADIPHAVITDPRTLTLDLATGRLLTRRYLGQEKHVVPRNVMASEVRVFLMDGSGSMLGDRARMRDAIIVAELSTMIARLNQRDRWLTPTLYYRYFNEQLGPVHEVSGSEQAVAAVEHVLGEVRWGGTDIQGALVESFATVRAAKQRGEDLAHAQIVLVTDGEAEVDEKEVTNAREAAGDVPIGVSIIALGQENPALRNLAARQRQRGERVFYQFVPDALIRDLVRGHEVMLPLHLPDSRTATEIDAELSALVRELEFLQRKRDEDALASVKDELSGLDEVGMGLSELPETERARILALSRDRDTLARRFERWFPHLGRSDSQTVDLKPSDQDEAQLAELSAIVLAVAETTDLAGGTDLRRQSDAVEMLERLLCDAGTSFSAYERLLARYPASLSAAVAEVRRVVGLDAPAHAQASSGSASDHTAN